MTLDGLIAFVIGLLIGWAIIALVVWTVNRLRD